MSIGLCISGAPAIPTMFEISSFDRTGKLGGCPTNTPAAVWCGGDQLRAGLLQVLGKPAAFADLRVVTQYPVHRGHRTQIDALVEQLHIHLERSLIDETVAVEDVEDAVAWRSMSVCLFVGSAAAAAGVGTVAAAQRRPAVERTTPVNARAVPVDTPAAVRSHHAAVSSCSACRRNPLSRKEIPREQTLFP